MVQIMAYGVLNMAKTVAAQMFAAVPAGDHNDMIMQFFPLQHSDDDHAGPGFAVVTLGRSIPLKEGPAIMSSLGEFFTAAELLDKGLCLRSRAARPARNRIFRPPVRYNPIKYTHRML